MELIADAFNLLILYLLLILDNGTLKISHGFGVAAESAYLVA
jgi:hypothetical protein